MWSVNSVLVAGGRRFRKTESLQPPKNNKKIEVSLGVKSRALEHALSSCLTRYPNPGAIPLNHETLYETLHCFRT